MAHLFPVHRVYSAHKPHRAPGLSCFSAQLSPHRALKTGAAKTWRVTSRCGLRREQMKPAEKSATLTEAVTGRPKTDRTGANVPRSSDAFNSKPVNTPLLLQGPSLYMWLIFKITESAIQPLALTFQHHLSRKQARVSLNGPSACAAVSDVTASRRQTRSKMRHDCHQGEALVTHEGTLQLMFTTVCTVFWCSRQSHASVRQLDFMPLSSTNQRQARGCRGVQLQPPALTLLCLSSRDNNEANMTRTDGFFKSDPPLLEARSRRRPLTEMLHLLSAVFVWLVTGSTISSLNKWIFAVYNFRYPLLLSALHMLSAIVVDYVLIKLRIIHHRRAGEQELTTNAKCKVFLLSLTFCASIAFGNMGLTYVQLSFAQMIYTTTPLFTLAISTFILGKQHHIVKYTAMMPICLGASFSIMGEVQYDQTGCFFVFAATMLRGVKSIQQSILLQEEKINSMFLLYLMAIPSFASWPCMGSVMYNLASNCVITLTSAVTLHVLGNLNVVGNLLLSQVLFGSELSALSCVGAVLTLSGMLIYQNSEFIIKYMDARGDKDKAQGLFNALCTEDRSDKNSVEEFEQRIEDKLHDKVD
ncbi:hypothetical protein WMY93_021049 [Mugilogobius chulae]|uniref:Sugar phosphate transporter domain-containing protein n=1 Tax=Mugilogobius chulae TaxID=88201 RepID=A0AAW0NE49_9GOBI